MSLRSGELVDGRYEVLELLGRGGMGAVYRALDRTRGVVVALKVIRPDLAGEVDVERFLREAELAARLDRHADLVRVHAAGRHEGAPYYVMELVEGRDLATLLREEGGVEPRRLAGIVERAARAVATCHAAGVVHRDIKPANVLVDDTGRTRLLDFGVARDLRRHTRLTATGDVLGTPAYMAPEQIDGGGVDERADVYALGAVLYEGLAGRPAFSGSLVNVLAAKVSRDPPAPSSLREGVPADLEAICRRAMARAPEERHPGAAALADDLARWAAGEPIPALVARRRRRGVVVAAVAALSLGVVAVALVAHARTRAAAEERRRAAEAALDEALEWDGWRCAAGSSCGGAHALTSHALGLGAGPAPTAATLDARASALEDVLPDLPATRRDDGAATLGRLQAWQRRLDPAAPPAANPTGALVEALEAVERGDVRGALTAVAPTDAALPERPLVLGRLAVAGLRGGPDEGLLDDLQASIAAAPVGVDSTTAPGLSSARAEALRDDAAARAWGEDLGRRSRDGAAQAAAEGLIRLLRVGPRDLALEEAFLAAAQAPLLAQVKGNDLALYQAVLAERALVSALDVDPVWELRKVVDARLTALQRAGEITGSPALVLAALAVGHPDGMKYARRVDAGAAARLVADPDASRAVNLIRMLDGDHDPAPRLAWARAVEEAPGDDLAPSLLAEAIRRRVESAAALLRAADADVDRAAVVAEGRGAAERFRQLAAADRTVVGGDLVAVLRAEVSLECRAGSPSAVSDVIDRLVGWIDAQAAAPRRDDWAEVRAAGHVGMLQALLDEAAGPGASDLIELRLRVARDTLRSPGLGTDDAWRVRGWLQRILRDAGRLEEALELVVEAGDPRGWAHVTFAAEAARTLVRGGDLEGATAAIDSARRLPRSADGHLVDRAAEELRRARARRAR